MITRIRKWGNSLGVRIPKQLAEDARVEEGARVDLAIDEGRLVIVPVNEKAATLEELLQKVTPENLHGETDFGAPRGREVW